MVGEPERSGDRLPLGQPEGAAKPIKSESILRMRLNCVTIGIEPPIPIRTAWQPHSADSAPRGMITVTADDDRAFSDLPEHATTALFRMAQESVTNALKHSKAESIEVSLTRSDDAVVLVTHDNGQGFDPRESDATGHYGMSSLAERCTTLGASLTIDSAPGEGTTVTVRLAL